MAAHLRRGLAAAGSAAAVLAALLTTTPPATAADPTPAAEPAHPDTDYLGSSIPAAERATTRRLAARAQNVAPEGTPGIDVSRFQGTVDWTAVAAGGAKFAYIKATESSTYTDSTFAANYTASAAAGLKRGAYHFALPDTGTGTVQADYFLAHGGGWVNDGKTLPPVLDLEFNPYSTPDWTGWCYNQTPAQILTWIRDFTTRVHDTTNRWPLIYTTAAWWSHCTGDNTTNATNSPLWITGDTATLPTGWTAYTLYQWATSGTLPGGQDVFAGTPDQITSFAAGTGPDKITEHYTQLGGANSTLGTPSGSIYQTANGWAQNYTSGTIYYSPATGAWALRGPILTKYQQLGGPAGPTGFPIGDSNPCGDGVGQFAHFANNASIFHHPNTSAHAVYGLIRQKWAGMGWERSTLGYPLNDEDGTPDGIGRFNHFSNGGSIYYTPTTGAHWINGLIKARWAALGWERSYLRYPTSDEYVITGGWRNDFQGGYIYYTSGPAAVDHPW